MNTSRLAIYGAAFLVLVSALYFFAFFRPNQRRIEQLHIDIAAANVELSAAVLRSEFYPQRMLEFAQLMDELERQEAGWYGVLQLWQQDYLRFMPETVDDADITHRIQQIVSPHAGHVDVQFLYSQPLGVMNYSENNPNGPPEGVWLTPIYVSFSVGHSGLLEILRTFASSGIDNRVIAYELNRNGDMWNALLRLDILTQTPSPHRFNGEYVVDDTEE